MYNFLLKSLRQGTFRLTNFSTNVNNFQCENLKHRTVLNICGKDCDVFLQGLITNDVRQLSEMQESGLTLNSIYSLMLNVQGRVIFDIFLYKNPSCAVSESIFLECQTHLRDDLIKHLNKYKIRRKIDIIPTEKQVWWFKNKIWNDQISNKAILVEDLRTPSMGYRGLLEKDDLQKLTAPEIVEGNYRATLYELGIGEGPLNHPPGNCLPLECNGDYLNGISFQKGCYIGQELTSRVYHTGVVRKRILPIKFETECESQEEMTIENEAGKAIGKVRGTYGRYGIALMRLQETFAAKVLKCQMGMVETLRPSWWPVEVKKE